MLATKFGSVRGPDGAFLEINGTLSTCTRLAMRVSSALASIISICTINIG